MSAANLFSGKVSGQVQRENRNPALLQGQRRTPLLEQLELRVMLSVTPSIVANRTTGVAPLAINFDASGTTSTATSIPLHEVEYSWNFADAASGTWSVSGKSRNTALGPIA